MYPVKYGGYSIRVAAPDIVCFRLGSPFWINLNSSRVVKEAELKKGYEPNYFITLDVEKAYLKTDELSNCP